MAELPIDPEGFLTDYWQREPLLIRNALPHFVPPVSADELAGLAMEEQIESRLIAQQDDGRWLLQHGPFVEADYQRESPWTLLVQAVDHYVPEVAALLELVDFLPSWRADDVMISYASDGGSVGPHYDEYDVFLLQGEGQRLWRLGQRCDGHSALLPDCDLRILERFDTQAEYLLNPGDILYVPPRLAHWGIARGECTTYSIGFRAPRHQELLARLTDQILEQAHSETLFTDPQRIRAASGEISAADIDRARSQLVALLQANADPRWFGELVTEPRYGLEPAEPDAKELKGLLDGSLTLQLAPESRLAWSAADALYVFANGQTLETLPALQPLVSKLCENKCLSPELLAPATIDVGNEVKQLLEFFLVTGTCYVE